MAYGDFKDLTRRVASDKVLRDNTFNIAKNPKSDGYQRGLASMVNKCFDKKSSDGVATLTRLKTLATRNKSAIKNENISNKKLADELHKLIIRKSKKGFFNIFNFYRQYLGC